MKTNLFFVNLFCLSIYRGNAKDCPLLSPNVVNEVRISIDKQTEITVLNHGI